MQSNIRILGIDPGYERLGYAIVEKPLRGKEIVTASGCIRTKANTPFFGRLKEVGEEVERIISQYKPTILAIEQLYFATNAKTVMSVSEARGVILYAGARNGLSVFEYTPLQIKTTVTGDGRADKKQLMFMIPKLATIESKPKLDDEFDAIAVALTCFARERF
ncbi:MAG: crossover junction endodeoxyribonuclease RuvC [bacterium]|nr:crossover junction endodeoxyribonuclease RuvC [bacterium]